MILEPCGHPDFKTTLCIGLDLAWFGGSVGNPDSQHDYLLSCILSPNPLDTQLLIERLKLIDRDPSADIISTAIEAVIAKNAAHVERVVLAVDAPLQTTTILSAGQTKAWRAADRAFSAIRQGIDRQWGGSRGWQPTLQPGAPIPPRVKALTERMMERLGFNLWEPHLAHSPRLLFETFPSEALWAFKRLGAYPTVDRGHELRRYKKLRKELLSDNDILDWLTTLLMPAEPLIHCEGIWRDLVTQAAHWLLGTFRPNAEGRYRVGKFFDDLIDTLFCLATAISYAKGHAHVFMDLDAPRDGHMIGPGALSTSSGQNAGRNRQAFDRPCL